jgi:MYXO-CTERM domain-containing protein
MSENLDQMRRAPSNGGRARTRLLASLWSLACWVGSPGLAHASALVVPGGVAATDGGSFNHMIITTNGRTQQFAISATSLPGLAVGDQITGIAFRSGEAAASAAISFTNFDVYFGSAATAVGSMVSAPASNISNPVLVRSGALSLAAGAFAANPGDSNPAPWGTVIAFTTPYVYSGGDLVYDIRVIGGTVQLALDAVAATDYSGLLQGRWSVDFNNPTRTLSQAYIPVIQLLVQSSAAPAPSSLLLMLGGLGGLALIRRPRGS